MSELDMVGQDAQTLLTAPIKGIKSVYITVGNARFRIKEKDGKLHIEETNNAYLATIGHSRSSIFITSEDF